MPSSTRSWRRIDIGYTDAGYGFGCDDCAVINSIDRQSPDIARGVDAGGAGDQGLMFGYACRETSELMPLPITLAHALTRRLVEVRKAGEVDFLRPDGKSQVTVEYEGLRPVRVHTVVVSTQHEPSVSNGDLHAAVRELVIAPAVPAELLVDRDGKPSEPIIHVNPTGRFEVGGPYGDCGLTGRKIIVDTYGGMASHGGGAFSGKDPTKVDRSASYMARYVAKNIVCAELAERATVQLAYAIGVADPVSVHIDTSGTGTIDDRRIETAVREVFRLQPKEIIETLDLRRPIFRKTARNGHFGSTDPDFSWERCDRAGALRQALGLEPLGDDSDD